MMERRSRKTSAAFLLIVCSRLLGGGNVLLQPIHALRDRARGSQRMSGATNDEQHHYANSTIYRDLRMEGYVHEDYHWKRELDEVLKEDVCKNGRNYGKCNENRFPKCKSDEKICMYRQPRTDSCADGKECKDPYYYINYSDVKCVPLWNERAGRKFNCNKCDPGKYCPTFNRCVKRKKRFCPDWCGPGRRWCATAGKCLRFRNLDRKRKRENCPDPEWHESIPVRAFKRKRTSGRISAAYDLDPSTSTTTTSTSGNTTSGMEPKGRTYDGF